MRIAYILAAAAFSASVMLFIYGTWLGIIQKSSDDVATWSGIMFLVALCCLALGFFTAQR